MKANSREDAAIRRGALALVAISILSQAAVAQIYPRPTCSSPIAVSRDDRLIWVVNPSDDSVSVIRPDNNTRITKIAVGDEPESIALTPNGQYAYVANAAGNNVTIIRINDPAWGTFSANVMTHLTTGAEPWNIVTSPDGLRVFVANSAQDTVTVIDAATRAIIGHVDLRNSIANDPDRSRHFQPRGLAVTADNSKLYVTRFLSFTKAGGRQGDDLGKEGLVAVLDINTSSLNIADYSVARTVALAPQVTGFKFPGLNNPPAPDTFAFANQMQSIVIRGDRAYLANIAASPTGPLRFNLDTHAFINQIGAVNSNAPTDLGALNLHLGARDPEPGKRKLFFANPWAIAFTSQSGAGSAYAVSAASDLLVKLNVAADNSLSFTGDADTTSYIDLNDPDNAATSGLNAGKNPQGIAINSTGTVAYVANFVSRNVSVVDLTTDTVIATVRTSDLPAPGSQSETNLVGAEMFFSSRGNFDSIPGTNSLRDRLSSEGWQSCASCHFKGLTDGVIWQFAAGPRKSVPLNSSFNPQNRNQQRLLNYSAIFDEIEDFEINIRNVSGPGPLAGGALDPNHGLLIGDNGDLNVAPSAVNAFALPNGNRQQVTVTLPGSANKIPALTAMREWVRFAVRTPNAPVAGLPNAPAMADIAAGRTLFSQAGCANCHGGQNWTISLKDFASPPASAEIFTERTGTFTGNPIGAQYMNRFLRDIGSFNLGVPGHGNPLGNNVGADEKAAPAVVGGVLQAAQDGLGIDYNADGKGVGFNVPPLLGLYAVPPYMHNGAAESLAAVVADVKHRTDNGRMADLLSDPEDQAQVVKFLESIDVRTVPLQSLIVLETFDDVPEGSLPGGWSVSNQTTVVTAGLDLNNPNSDSYLNWVVINSNRLVTIFGTNRISSALDAPLVSGNLAYAESDRRNGSQVQVLFSPDYNLGNWTNVHLSFHSIYAQNQDSSASVEYSIDGGNTWLPALYMMDESDVIRDGGGAVDAVATLTAARPDQAYGLSYGTWIGAPITPALAPFISGRVNDDQVESKRIEVIRLPQADHQSTVRLRFAQSGTASWYFGVDDIGLYGDLSALDTTPPQLTCPQSVNTQATSFAGATVNFTVTATDALDPSPVVVCTPPSSSMFPIGTTEVSCVARDASGNTSGCTFSVSVSALVFGGSQHVPLGNATLSLSSNGLVVSNFGANTPGGLTIALPLPAQKITVQLDPVSLSTPGAAITFQVFEPARKGGGNDFDPPQLLSRVSLVNRSNVLEMTSSFWDYDWWWCFTEIPAQVFQSSLTAPLRVEAQARLTEVTAETNGNLKLTFADPVNVTLPDNTTYRVRNVWIAPVTESAQSRPVGQLVLSGQQLPSVRIQSEEPTALRPKLDIQRLANGNLALRKNWPYQNRIVLREAPAITGPWPKITNPVLAPGGPSKFHTGEVVPRDSSVWFKIPQRNRVGINFVAVDLNPDNLDDWPEEVLPDLEALEATALRQVGSNDVMWRYVWNQESSTNDWNRAVDLKNWILETGRDLRFIPTLFQVNKYSGFDAVEPFLEYPTAPDQTKLSDAANKTLVKTYVKEAATNLHDLTPYFEVLNELTGYSSFTEAEYATVLKWCREALDEAEAETDTELKIVLGGMINEPSLDWLKNVATELGSSAGDYIDVISFHYYDGWPELQTFIVNLKNTLASTGLDAKPLWLTEAGLTPAPTPPGSIDEAAELQAHEMFQKFSIAFGNGVELANWHPLVSTCDPTDPPDPECTFGGYGLHQVGTGTATMAWDAYQLFAAKLGNFITCTPVSEGPEIWAYRYAVPVFSFDSIYRNYWVIWTWGSSSPETLEDIDSTISATDDVTVTSVASGFPSKVEEARDVEFGRTPILVEDRRWHTSP